jgi:hypothetical protein
MPRAVQDLRRVDRGIAFYVAAHVHPEGQQRAVLLERKQHALRAFLAEDLAEALEISRLGPSRDGHAR